MSDDQPLWPHDQQPPDTADKSWPRTYVVEMTAIGVRYRTGPAPVVQAIIDRLSPRTFAQQCVIIIK
jgi:hypothetical protein